jgi:hypothetical protein
MHYILKIVFFRHIWMKCPALYHCSSYLQNQPIFGRFLNPHAIVECTQQLEAETLFSSLCVQHVTSGSVPSSYLTLLGVQQEDASSLSNTQEAITKLTQYNPQGILYDFTKDQAIINSETELNAIARVQAILAKPTGSEDAEHFLELKRALKNIVQGDLGQFVTPEISLGKKQQILLDAAAEVTTDAAIEFLVKTQLQGELDDTITKMNFYTHVAFASKPGVRALVAMKSLLISDSGSSMTLTVPTEYNSTLMEQFQSNVTLIQQLLLGASGLAYRFCQTTTQLGGCRSAQSAEYASLVDAIASHAKPESHEEVRRGALHALSNLDVLTPSAVQAIISLLDNSPGGFPETILALDAFRRDSCQAELKEKAKTLFQDKEKPDELRIHAYLAMSKCLIPVDVEAINAVLADTEGNNGKKMSIQKILNGEFQTLNAFIF